MRATRARQQRRHAERLTEAAFLPVGNAFDLPPRVAPGVLAFVREVDGMTLIPFVTAERQGRGDVGRWLDTLPRDRYVVFVNVESDILAGMLDRRGFHRAGLRIGTETADVMLRRPFVDHRQGWQQQIHETSVRHARR